MALRAAGDRLGRCLGQPTLRAPRPCPGAGDLEPRHLPNARAGEAYQATLAGQEQGLAFRMLGGALPAGVELSAQGVVAGTPPIGVRAASYDFLVEAKGRAGGQVLSYTLAIVPVPVAAQDFVPPGCGCGATRAEPLVAAGFLWVLTVRSKRRHGRVDCRPLT